MKSVILLVLALGLTGCASWTPEQRADFAARMQAWSAAQQQAQQIQYQEQMANIRAAQAQTAANKPVNCVTNYVGAQAYTTCQ